MVDAVGSVRVIPVVASIGSFLGFLSACFLVIYPDLEPSSSEQDQHLVDSSVDSDQNGERANGQKLTLQNVTDGDNSKMTEDHSVA